MSPQLNALEVKDSSDSFEAVDTDPSDGDDAWDGNPNVTKTLLEMQKIIHFQNIPILLLGNN